jgi:glyoxylase-like metal-dependent hydrolase (beta-lactamase superfamily II)
MSDLCEVAENIYLIDTKEGSIPKLTAAYFLNEGGKALIDAGSPNSAGTILEGIKRLGVDPKEVSCVVITHVHLDHAGGAGTLIKEMPYAKVLVHPRGAKHLVDPTKLISSAMQVLSQEEMDRYGSMIPVSQEKVKVLDDNAVIELNSQQRLRVIYTPGHAHHHLSLWEERNKGLFAGDAIGEYVPEAEFLFVDTPAPSFDLESALESIERVRQLPLQILYFGHFGVSRKAEEILRVAQNKLRVWGEMVYQAMKNNPGDLVENLREFIYAELEPIRSNKDYYSIWTAWATESIHGYVDYFRRREGSLFNLGMKGSKE